MRKFTKSNPPLSETEGELKLIIKALCYAVTISTDDVHKKYLAELVYRISKDTSLIDPEKPTLSAAI